MNKLFHKGYFREVFRQLMVPGIVAAAILMLTNVSSAISLLPSLFLTQETMFMSIPSGIMLAYPMMIYVYIAGLALTLSAFGWLNKRSQSDFYHAIPVTRNQLYGSTFAAIMIWLLIGLCAYALVHAFIYLVTGMPFNYLLYFCVFINMVIGAVEVVGAVSIACAISGTRFVNFFAAAAILFMPRFLLTVMAEFVKELAPLSLDLIASSGIFFDPSYNIFGTPYAEIIELLGSGSNYAIDFAKPAAMIWSFVYSALLVFLGGVAFHKRSSETAGMPSKSKIIQAAVRTAFGLPLLLVFMYLIVSGDATLIGGVLLVLFAFIFYCLYELISTKSIKKMAKAMPLFAICIGISLLYLVIPHLIIGIEKNAKADEDNIKGYYTVETGGGLMSLLGFGGSDETYSAIMTGSVEINDQESVNIIARAYKRTMGNESSVTFQEGNGTWIPVRIDRKIGRDLVRTLFFFNSEYVKLVENVEKNEAYARYETEFPKGRNYFSIDGLNKAETGELVKTYMEEYESLSPEIKRSLKQNSYNGIMSEFDMAMGDYSYRSASAAINVAGCVGAKNYFEGYAINSYTPKTLGRYVDLINERNGDEGLKMIDEIKIWFENGNDGDNSYFGLSPAALGEIYYYNTVYSNVGGNKLPKDTDPEYYEVVKILSSAKLADSSNIDNAFKVTVTVDWHEFPTAQSLLYGRYKTIYLNISDEDYARITELIAQAYERYDSIWDDPSFYE